MINITGLPSFISKTCLDVVESVSRQDSVDISWDLWQTLEICQNRIQATETTNINLETIRLKHLLLTLPEPEFQFQCEMWGCLYYQTPFMIKTNHFLINDKTRKRV